MRRWRCARLLKQSDDTKNDRRNHWLTQKLTKDAMHWSLEMGETFDRFCHLAIAERITRIEASQPKTA